MSSDRIEGFDPVVPLLVSDCYPDKKHVWVVMFEGEYLDVVKCEHCLTDVVLYKDLKNVAEKLFGYRYRRDQ